MLEFTEVSAMDRCSLCGTLIVRADLGVRRDERLFCTARCARVSEWYTPAEPPAGVDPLPPAA